MVFEFIVCGLLTHPILASANHKPQTHYLYKRLCWRHFMKKIRKFYDEYKPYIFSDGWYYVFIVIFILILFIFFS